MMVTLKERSYKLFQQGFVPSNQEAKTLIKKKNTRYNYYHDWLKGGGVVTNSSRPATSDYVSGDDNGDQPESYYQPGSTPLPPATPAMPSGSPPGGNGDRPQETEFEKVSKSSILNLQRRTYQLPLTPILTLAYKAAIERWGFSPNMPPEDFIDAIMYQFFLDRGIMLMGYVVLSEEEMNSESNATIPASGEDGSPEPAATNPVGTSA